MRIGLVQLCSGDDPAANLPETLAHIRAAAAKGARFVLTPEVTNMVSTSREKQDARLCLEANDPTLAALRAEAKALGIWLLIGSLAVKTPDADGRFANRSILIDPGGEITARYDKIHMFDVQVSETESYRESAGYRPGAEAVLAEVEGVGVGLTICYDLRFAHLFRALAQAGAEIIMVPSAFSPTTGAAHWEVLLRARAIETGCYILAPAQCGQNTDGRATYGHSLIVDPWGKVVADGGETPGVVLAELDLGLVHKSRARVPSLRHDRAYSGPHV